MARLLTKVWRWGRGALAGILLGGAWTGCAGDDFMPLPPGGFLDDGSYRWDAADEEAAPVRDAVAPSKAETKTARQQAARAAAAEKKKAAAEEKAQRRREAQPAADRPPAAAPEEALPPAEIRAENVAPAAAPANDTYVLQPGDEIDVQVYREPELSGMFKLGAAGEIRHSLIGVVPLAGQTVEAAEADITRRLAKDYLVNPRVIVKLAATQGSQVVVLGEVKKPGVYPLPFGEKMTLLQAIAGAGGFTELASPDRVSLVRRLPDGGQTTLKIRVSDLLGGKGKQPDVPLEPNDVIMIPQVFF